MPHNFVPYQLILFWNCSCILLGYAWGYSPKNMMTSNAKSISDAGLWQKNGRYKSWYILVLSTHTIQYIYWLAMNNDCSHLWSDSTLLFTHDYISDEKHWWINHPTCDQKNYPWQAMSYPLYQPLYNTGPIFCHYIFRPGPRIVGINFYGI